MVYLENISRLFDYGLIEDITVPDGSSSAPTSGFSWPMQGLNVSSNVRGWKEGVTFFMIAGDGPSNDYEFDRERQARKVYLENVKLRALKIEFVS